MRILGIDPGYAIVGFGVVDYDGRSFTPIEYGTILTEADTEFPLRLKAIAEDMDFICERFEPDCVSIEKLFFNSNHKTAIDVAQARGVTVLSVVRHDIELNEYTPLQVKQAVVGYGKAEKKQVMDMTRRILRLDRIPRPDDAADALALAVCHGHCCKGKILSERTDKLIPEVKI